MQLYGFKFVDKGEDSYGKYALVEGTIASIGTKVVTNSNGKPLVGMTINGENASQIAAFAHVSTLLNAGVRNTGDEIDPKGEFGTNVTLEAEPMWDFDKNTPQIIRVKKTETGVIFSLGLTQSRRLEGEEVLNEFDALFADTTEKVGAQAN